jgi:hypothetical protein
MNTGNALSAVNELIVKGSAVDEGGGEKLKMLTTSRIESNVRRSVAGSPTWTSYS